MECPICYNIIKKSCVGSCMHHFCYECLIKWIKISNNNTTNCPICKDIFYELRFDNEFDIVNNPDYNYQIKRLTNIIEIDINSNSHFGIRISNNKQGVIVVNVKEKDLCYKYGIRKNDILLYINNIPCVNHIQTINILNLLKKFDKNPKIELLPKSILID
jgi:hypothetical protein